MSAFFSVALTALVKKEFLSVLKDRTSRMILVAPIILYIILFGYIASFNLERIPYAVCDLAKTELSSELIRRIEAGGIFQRVATLTNTAQVRRAVDETDALVVAVIAPDFSSRFYSGRTAPVQVVVDGRNSTTAQLAAGYLQTIVSDFSAEKSGVTAGVAMRLFYNPNNITQWFIMPGLIVMLSMLQTVVLAALSVAREREQGTFEQLSVTPVTTGQILFAKAFVPMVVGLMQACLILAADLWWFRIPLAGSFAQIFLRFFSFLSRRSWGWGLRFQPTARTCSRRFFWLSSTSCRWCYFPGFLRRSRIWRSGCRHSRGSIPCALHSLQCGACTLRAARGARCLLCSGLRQWWQGRHCPWRMCFSGARCEWRAVSLGSFSA